MPSTSTLDITCAENGSTLLITITGDAGVANAGELERRFTTFAAMRPLLVVIDLSGLSFISSLGIGVLMEYQRGVNRHGGQVRLAALQPSVSDILRSCRLDTVFKLCDSVDAALSA